MSLLHPQRQKVLVFNKSAHLLWSALRLGKGVASLNFSSDVTAFLWPWPNETSLPLSSFGSLMDWP